jgi:hypothetical protein
MIDCKHSKEIDCSSLVCAYECELKNIILNNECENCKEFKKG